MARWVLFLSTPDNICRHSCDYKQSLIELKDSLFGRGGIVALDHMRHICLIVGGDGIMSK